MQTDDDIRRILTETRVIAVVGWSPKPDRPSHGVARFLSQRGYTVIPVNPGQVGVAAFGTTVRASLGDVDEPVDMVDIFRRAEDVMPVVEQALTLPTVKTIWMQLGIINDAAAALARERGLAVVMNRCPAIEIPRLRL